MNRNYYRGWDIFYSSIGSQNWVAKKQGVTMRANSKELLFPMIDNHEKENKKPWVPLGNIGESKLILTKEDIQKYGTEEEQGFLKENYGMPSAVYALDREVRNEVEEEIEELWNETGFKSEGDQTDLAEFQRKIKLKGDWPVDNWRDVYAYALQFLKSSGYKINLK